MTNEPTPVITPDLHLLRADLLAADYTVDGVQAALGDLAAAALGREQAVPALRALAGNESELATLIRLFILGREVSVAQAEAAFAGLRVAGAVNAQLVRVGPHGVRALAELRPAAMADTNGTVNWWLASDLSELATGAALHAEHVLGAGGASITLAQVTARDRVGRVLDLGTGSGIQALYASRHASEIVATDLSVRALEFARFNAALNEVHFDLRAGSMLEPVAGESFDLVVSNPPFVITPRGSGHGGTVPQYEYRDGGAAGDDIVKNLIQDVGGVLAPGGRVFLLGNWEITAGTPWQERIEQWLDAAEAAHGPLDAWVIQREVLDPAQYAQTWIRDGGTTADRDPEGYAATFDSWLSDFASRDVGEIGFGIVVLRKPEAGQPRTLRRLEEVTGSVAQPLGPVFAAALAAQDWVSAHTDDELCAQRLMVAPDVTEERYFTPGSDDPNIIIIRQGGGLRRTVQAGTALAGLVGACDGELTVGQIIGAIASLFEVDEQTLRTELMTDLRGLIVDGLLSPVGLQTA